MGKLAINGGKKIVDRENFWTSWPIINEDDRNTVLKVLNPNFPQIK